MFVFITVSLLFLIWSVYYHLSKFRLYKLSWNVPGPLALPFIGSGYLFTGTVAEIAQTIMKLYAKYPDFFKIWIGTNLFYFVSKPEYLKVILNSSHALKKSEQYDFVKPIFGDGLITAPANTWKIHRKVLQPSFKQTVLNQFPQTISKHCNILIETLQNLSTQEIDPSTYITNCTIDIISETLLGSCLNAQFSNVSYGDVIDEMMDAAFLQMLHVLYQFEFIFSQTNKYKHSMKNVHQIKKNTGELIEKKIEDKRLKVLHSIDDNKSKSFMDLIIEKYLKHEWSSDELEDEVNTFLLAGTDTTAVSLSFVLTMLGMHQEIQKKVYEEIVEIIRSNHCVQLEDLSKLKYTERVIKETLRLFPTASLTARFAIEDINLGNDIIPKNSNITFNFLHLHRNAKYWTDPLKFDPDRFLPERSSEIHPYTWIPFSAGPRNCIGWKLGMMTTTIMTALIIQKFKVISDLKNINEIELKPHIVLKPKNGFKLRLELR